MAKFSNVLESIIYILLIAFAIFIIYQLILKIFGGSWETQDIAIALLVIMLGLIFNIAIRQAKLETNLNHFSRNFFCLARDFKNLSQEFRTHINEKH